MACRLITSLLVSFLIGFAITTILWPSRMHRALRIILGFGLGSGLVSILVFLWLLLFDSWKGYLWVEGALAVVAVAFLLWTAWRGRSNTESASSVPHAPVTMRPMYIVLAGLLLVSLVIVIILMLQLSAEAPHGRWDAWAIWNLKARIMFLGGDQWTDIFSVSMGTSHPDYPLLIPGIVARGFQYVGHVTQVVPAILSTGYALLIVALAVFGLWALRSGSHGLLAGLILFATPTLTIWGVAQISDIPLAFYMLATLVLFCLLDAQETSSDTFAILAGFFTGLAAWTKNEGMLFVVVVIVARFVSFIPSKDWKTYWRQMRSFFLGFLPVLGVMIYFQVGLAPANDVVNANRMQSVVEKLLDFPRYAQVASAYFSQMTEFGDWPFSIALVLAICLLLFGIDTHKATHRGAIATVATLSLMLAGYFMIYVVTPHDLTWHLETSLHRLLLQLWPMTIFAYFQVIRIPKGLRIDKWVSSRVAVAVTSVLGLAFLGGVLVRSAIGMPVTTWMHVYRPEDFVGAGQVIAYLKSLRVGIPPVLSLLEIVNYNLTGSSRWITVSAYRVGLVLAYVIPLLLFYPRGFKKVTLTSIVSVVFLCATVIIHPKNPQVYDILFPVFVLLFLLLYRYSRQISANRTLTVLATLGAGLFLSLAELSRPFMLLVLPVVLVCVGLGFRRANWKYFLVFLIPIILLSGGWHLKTYICNNGQIVWSNHGGYNLRRAWPMALESLSPEEQASIMEEAPATRPDRWPNLNTEIHYQNSRVYTRVVLRYIVEHPMDSVKHVWEQTKTFFAPQTSIYEYQPQHPILSVYRIAVWLATILLLFNLIRLLVWLIKDRSLKILGKPESILIIVTVLSIAALIVGDTYEQARFLISVLPFLAVQSLLIGKGESEQILRNGADGGEEGYLDEEHREFDSASAFKPAVWLRCVGARHHNASETIAQLRDAWTNHIARMTRSRGHTILNVLIVLCLMLGSARVLLLVLHDPLYGYANNYDFVRMESWFQLWPNTEGTSPTAAHGSAPFSRYRFGDPDTPELRYVSSELLFIYSSIKLHPLVNRILDIPSDVFDIRTLGCVKAIAFILVAGWLTCLYRKRSTWLGVLSAMAFLIFFSDPANIMYFNTLYTEFSVFLFSYLSIGLLFYIAVISATRLPSLPLTIVLFVSLLLLGTSKMQFYLVPLILSVFFLIVVSIRFWGRVPVTYLILVLLLTFAVMFGIFQLHTYQDQLGLGTGIRLANATHTYLGALLPAMDDPVRGLEILQIPDRCAEYIGREKNAPWFAPPPCPETTEVSRLRVALVLLREPQVLTRMVAIALPQSRPLLLQHLGHIEGEENGSLKSDNTLLSLGLSSLIDGLSYQHYKTLLALTLAGIIVSMFQLIWFRIKRTIQYTHARHRCNLSLFHILISIIVFYAFFSSLFGDGYVEFPKHFYLGQIFLPMVMCVSFAQFILTVKDLVRRFFPSFFQRLSTCIDKLGLPLCS